MGEKRGMKALEAWCRKVTEGYRDVNVTNMTTSWRDGLAFCAIIHHFRPDLIEYDTLNKENVEQNNELAFNVAEQHLGIPSLLDPEDMVKYKVPDKLSIMTYVSQFYQYFQGSGQTGSPVKSPKRHVEPSGSRNTSPESPPSKVPAIIPSAARQPDVCQACSNRVYILERLIIDNKLYHRTCFKCCRCQSLLKPGSYVDGSKPGQYECASCPDEEEAEKAAIASMTAARLAHINSPVSPDKWTPLPRKLPVKNDDMKLSLAIADARKAFLTSPQSNENNTLASTTANDSESKNSHEVVNHMRVVSPYLFGEKEQKTVLPVKDVNEKKSEEQRITAISSSEEHSTKHNEEPEVLKQELQNNIVLKESGTKSEETTSVHLTKYIQQLPENCEKNNKPLLNSSTNISTNDQMNANNERELNVCSSNPLSDSTKINNIANEGKNQDDQVIPSEKNVCPVPSPRIFRKKQTLSNSCDKITDKTSEEIFVTPQASPEIRSRKQNIDLEQTESLVKPKSLTDDKDEISKVRPLSPTAASVHHSHFPENELPLSPSKSHVIVHDMPIIQPQINHHVLSSTRDKGNDLNIEPSKLGNIDVSHVNKKTVNSDEMDIGFKVEQQNEVEDKSVISTNEKTVMVITNQTELKDENSSDEKTLLENSTDKILKKENLSQEDKQICQDSSPVKGAKISSFESKSTIPLSSPVSDKSPNKKTPPPRPQLPSILIKSPTKPSPPSAAKTDSYPDDLNPFGEDGDDEGEEPIVKSTVTKKVEKSLNPFEDSEDEYQDALKPEDLVSSTPKTVPSQETPQSQRVLVKIKAPKGLNPFEDGEDDEALDDLSATPQELRHDDSESQESRSHDSSGNVPVLTDRPVPLPRQSIGTRSSSQSPVSSLGRSSGIKYASASSSPVGSLSKGTGKRHTLSGGSSPANSFSRATGQKYASRDSGLDISPMGSLSRNVRKKRPAPKPPSARMLFSSDEANTETKENNETIGKPSVTPHSKSSPCFHKKLPAPPPPVLHSNKNMELSEKTLKDLDNINLKSTGLDGDKSNEKVNRHLAAEKITPSSQKNTFGYWKKKKPAPPIPLPAKRQIAKLPMEDIERELAEIESKQLDLEQRGVELEKCIREGGYNGEDETNAEEEDLVLQLFDLVNQKNNLSRRQAELVYLKRQQRLEEEHAELEFQIRCLMDKSAKTREETEQEEELIKRLIEVVAQRNEIIESIEIDRVKEAMEDESIQEQMAVRQGSSRSSLNSQGSTNSVDHLGKKEKKKKEKELKKSKNKEKEKTKAHDEDKDLDDTEISVKEKTKKDKKRKWF